MAIAIMAPKSVNAEKATWQHSAYLSLPSLQTLS